MIGPGRARYLLDSATVADSGVGARSQASAPEVRAAELEQKNAALYR
jgi:hypothetical protein